MFAVNIPSLIIIGFLIGIILIIVGNRERDDMSRRNKFLRSGIIVVGIMIPVTPISWYGYWALSSSVTLMLLDYIIIAVAIVIGILVIVQGFRSTSK